jgi:23S rRNA pseudouridine2605 synthase
VRINKFLAQNTALSRRSADQAIAEGRVSINDRTASLGDEVDSSSKVMLDAKPIAPKDPKTTTVLLNKPTGYVCSKDGQGSKTVYDLLPQEYRPLNIAGRLDKDSSGLVLLTNDGELHNKLTHPSNKKLKEYIVETYQPLDDRAIEKLCHGIDIGDKRSSKFKTLHNIGENKYRVTIEEGRNRQIRRAIIAAGGSVTSLTRTKLGDYSLGDIKQGRYIEI